ncbi:MAG: YggT family protein [Methylococcaceae bacterium]|nr:YggT family protein [Methylococcaceae bacterium]
MNANYMTEPLIFIIESVFSLYILAVVLRFLLQWSRAEFYNPISQFLVKITHPVLKILRRYIPPVGKIDTSSIVLALGLRMFEDFSILMLKGFTISVGALALYSMSNLISLLFDVFIYAVIASAVLSWLNPSSFNAVSSILHSLTEPLLDTCRKFIPDFGGIDLSPLLALMMLQLAKMVIIPPLNQLVSLIS